jgi:hypothetical protein
MSIISSFFRPPKQKSLQLLYDLKNNIQIMTEISIEHVNKYPRIYNIDECWDHPIEKAFFVFTLEKLRLTKYCFFFRLKNKDVEDNGVCIVSINEKMIIIIIIKKNKFYCCWYFLFLEVYFYCCVTSYWVWVKLSRNMVVIFE